MENTSSRLTKGAGESHHNRKEDAMKTKSKVKAGGSPIRGD